MGHQFTLAPRKPAVIDIGIRINLGGLRVYGDANSSLFAAIDGMMYHEIADPITRALAIEVQHLRERLGIALDGGLGNTDDGVAGESVWYGGNN